MLSDDEVVGSASREVASWTASLTCTWTLTQASKHRRVAAQCRSKAAGTVPRACFPTSPPDFALSRHQHAHGTSFVDASTEQIPQVCHGEAGMRTKYDLSAG